MVRLIIDIRDELVTRWGGIIIEEFVKNSEGNLEYGHIGLPGFEYTLPKDKGKATFNFDMERIINDAEAKETKKENAGIHLLTDGEKEKGKLPPVNEDNGAGNKPDGQDASPE